ncbi:NRDE family protein [Sinomicrobium weinanense]|uniref:NRDE family protein n=1 Tax=Sinomicrobium weinanense TaxID=2842200 RepID=A0A926JU35_9FLAO|nr:NRDE family protein [Sinomicrobium weinanense]MBC9797548.1 NRDE family protein [Sinomicrobium weinanense]MBU3123903.1 NRDE family protein [Sinomicrobium weinanense]
MCTVSFIKTEDRVIITSNRDEKTTRPVALPPKIYTTDNKRIVFPKDPLSGGSWFTVDESGNTAVLLNGARQKHTPQGPYRKSRGLILLEIMAARSAPEYWNDMNLDNIEPFTVLLYREDRLYLLRWDGLYKETASLKTKDPYILSSSTLYTETLQKQREQWFFDFMDRNEAVSPEALLSFHRYTEEEGGENGLIINRNNLLKTLSITQCVIQKGKTDIHYLQLFPNEKFFTLQL